MDVMTPASSLSTSTASSLVAASSSSSTASKFWFRIDTS